MDIKRYNGKIYAIRSYQTELIYVGSTIEKRLSARFSKHKSDYKMNLKGTKNYVTSYEIVKYDDCYIELIEEVSNYTKDEMRKLEGQYIREMNCVNKRIEGRTKHEYYNNNKDKILDMRKEYYGENRDNIREFQKEYRIINKDELNEQSKKIYQENRDKILERKSTKYLCECGKALSHGNKAKHKKVCKFNSKAI